MTTTMEVIKCLMIYYFKLGPMFVRPMFDIIFFTPKLTNTIKFYIKSIKKIIMIFDLLELLKVIKVIK